MSQADLIRATAAKRFVEPARRRNQETLVIVAGEIGRELGLSNRMPNICNALQSRKFLEMAGVELLDPKPTKPAASARFSYAIKQKGEGLAQPNHADVPVALPAAGGHHQPAHRSTEPHGPQTADFTLVIPCAARKQANAGRLRTEKWHAGPLRRQSGNRSARSNGRVSAPGRHGTLVALVAAGAPTVQRDLRWQRRQPSWPPPGLAVVRGADLRTHGRPARRSKRVHPFGRLGPDSGVVPSAQLRHHARQ